MWTSHLLVPDVSNDNDNNDNDDDNDDNDDCIILCYIG